MYKKGWKLSFFRPFLLALLLCSTSVISLPRPKDIIEIEKLDNFDWKDFKLTPELPVKDVSDDIKNIPTVEIEQPEVLSPDPVSAPQEQIQEERSFQEPVSIPQEPVSVPPISVPQVSTLEQPILQQTILQLPLEQQNFAEAVGSPSTSLKSQSDSSSSTASTSGEAKEHILQESFTQETSEPATETSLQGQTPISQTPISQTPISQTPISQTPISETSISETSISETSISQTPISQTPISETSISETSISQTPISQTPISQTPISQTPISESYISQAPISQTPIPQETLPQETALQEPATESRQEENAPLSLPMNAIIVIIGVVVIFICLSIYLIYKRYKRNLDHDRNQSEIDFSSGKKLSTFSENDGDNKKYEANSRYSQNSLYSQNNYLKSSFGKNDDGDDNVSISSSLQSKALIPPNFTSSPLSSISGAAVQQESNKGQLNSSIGQKEIKSIENRNSSLLSGPSLSIKNDFDLRDSLPSVSTGSSELGSHYRDSLVSDNEMISKGHHTSYLPADFLSDEHFHDLANFNFAMMNPKESPRPPSVPTITAPSGPKSSATSTNTGLLGNPVYNTVHTLKSNTNENIEPILLKKERKPPKVKKTMGSVLHPSPLRKSLYDANKAKC